MLPKSVYYDKSMYYDKANIYYDKASVCLAALEVRYFTMLLM